MRITILTVPECPNVPVLRERIAEALDGRAAVIELIELIELIEVSAESDAARWGMTGSPTVLLDGIDPFPIPGAPPSVSCRLYRDAEGRTDGAPSVQALREAFSGARRPQAADEQDCCETDPLDPLDPIGRSGRGRRAPAERGLRMVQQAILRHFAATGRAPDAALLEPVAAEAGRTAGEVLAELDHEDFLTLDASGRIEAAYPFSAGETRHQVQLANGVSVWSMCAIDALGISAMLGQDVTVSSTDPVDAQPVTVSFANGSATWEPAEAVVFVGRREGEGPAAAVCCDALNFFTGQASAEQWQLAHPEVRGEIVSQACATRIGQQTFGPLLQDG